MTQDAASAEHSRCTWVDGLSRFADEQFGAQGSAHRTYYCTFRSTCTNTFMLSNIGCAVVLCKTIRIDLHALLMNNVEHRVLRTERTIVHLS